MSNLDLWDNLDVDGLEKTRLVLCGVGRIGKVHYLDLITFPHVQLVAIVDPILKTAQAMASQVGCKAYATIDEALEDPTVRLEWNGFFCVYPCCHLWLMMSLPLFQSHLFPFFSPHYNSLTV